ncbi:MAG: oxidoreductase [Proteobacteria bacterium]|nr:oxidoreductase [Pseudomonadota bacterium]
MIGETLRLKVAAACAISPSLRHLRLVAADGGKLPPAAAGAHLQLVLKGATRTHRNAYSLISRPGARDAYEIIVRRVPASRGGSAFIHEQIKVGDVLEAGWPGNLFAPVRTARRHLMIAGGIGITPFLSYLADFAFGGADYALHLCCREDEQHVFDPWLAGKSGVSVHWDTDGRRLDIPALLAAQPVGTHLYVCGPAAMNDEVLELAAAAGWPASHVHCEHFGSALSGGEAFHAFLAKSGVEVSVGEDESLLEAIERIGVKAPCLCRGGACGVCVTPLLEGEAEHRDHYLSAAEREAGRLILPCVSRARSGRLVLDL